MSASLNASFYAQLISIAHGDSINNSVFAIKNDIVVNNASSRQKATDFVVEGSNKKEGMATHFSAIER